ncbi:pilus assembly protein PilM [Caldisericum exile]|uniref:Uncharacterized protein n=1 Tax=Caldisericum exile (strain DSM 21853 / NBRC 104410 / AZM16c01) TaxID=511051 RepID=A0A7U6JF62_CALEA|nr:pilus assembly protein PilM [Caldisericum exile]BAL81441.1 hypothetical protein CSE_13150 [Caldisericum exile AZM16c01]
MGEKLLGVSISENAIRCALVERGEEITIKSLFEISFDDFNNVSQNKEVIDSLKAFLRKNRYDSCAISLPASAVLTRLKTVPKLPQEKIVKLIQTEIRDYAIFEGENVSLGFAELEKTEEGVEVIWAATKESTLLSTLNFLHKVGIKTRRITIPQLAIAEFIDELYKDDSYAVVNVDRATTTLTVSKGKRIIFNYTQDVGFQAFKENDVSLKGTWVGNIVSSLNYVSRNLNIAIKKIYLVINNSESFDMLPYLTGRVPIPVLLLTLPENVSFEDESDFIKYQKTGGNEFVVAVGLALSSLIKRGEAYYLSLTEHFLREKLSERLKVLTMVLVLVVVNGAFALAYPYLSGSLKSTTEKLNSVKKSISEISKPVLDVNKLQLELQAVNGTLNSLKNLEVSIYTLPKYSLVLKELQSLSPQGVSLIELALKEDGSVSLRGTSNTFKNVFNFEENLSGAKYLKNATVLEIIKDKEGSNIFSMEMQMRKAK